MAFEWTISVPVRPKPKARPRVTNRGTFMPKDYRHWRNELATLISLHKTPTFDGPVEIDLIFDTDEITMTVRDTGWLRVKHVRADLDNLIGAVMEVLEDTGIVENDRLVTSIHARFSKREEANG